MLAVCAQTGAGDLGWPVEMWSPATGTWRAEGSDYVQTDHRAYGAWSLWKGGAYVDVDVRVRFKIEPVGRGVRAAGIVFRAVDEQHFFFAHFDSKNNQLLITRWSRQTGWKHLARVPRVGLKQGVWHTGRVECAGSRATVYLDGRRIGTADGVSLLPGRVGLRTGQARVRYADWRVVGKPVDRQRPPAARPWWRRAWRRRIPLTIVERGCGDRAAALTKVRLDFGGHAHTLGPTRDYTDVVVVDAAGEVVPARVTRMAIQRGRIQGADVVFPVRVDWLSAARYDVYFDNPQATKLEDKELSMRTLSLTAPANYSLPANWRFVNGSWQRKALSRPEHGRVAVAAVKSGRHVAFPGICKTKRGALVVVYREGYSHASGNPDDGRVMLVRSTDEGKTWTEPQLAYDDPNMDDRNASVECMSDGTLCLLWDKYLRGRHHFAWMGLSTDDGLTWSEPMKVSKDENVHTRSRALDLGNGKWLLPYSESTNSRTASSYFSLYDPKTKTFEEIAATPFGQRNIADETAVARAANGQLVALIRSNTDPALWQIVSKDHGRTWSKARLTQIPSQFTPADLITLHNGWLLCGFSFRERRNERLVVSRDNGETWDVENSVDVFDGTPHVGGDRSYHAIVQIDEQTIGSVLYETQTPPTGGHIWFVTTRLRAFDAAKETALYQADTRTEAAFAVWPQELKAETIELAYRFTGLFGPAPNVVGLLLAFQDSKNYVSFEFQMGAATDRKTSPCNYVQLVQCADGERKSSHGRTAQGGWFDDGNIHRLGARRSEGQWALTIDGVDQFAVPESMGAPCGIITRRAAVAVYEMALYNQAVQTDSGSLDVEVGPVEER